MTVQLFSSRIDGVTEVPWLSDDELEAWKPLAALLLLAPPRLSTELAAHGLTFFEYSTLVVLDSADDRTLSTSELAVLANGELSRTSHGAKRLERRGLVERRRCPSDGRITLVTLTAAGRDLLVAAAPDHVRSVRQLMLDGLGPDDVRELGRISQLILDRLAPDGPWGTTADDA